MENFKRYAVYYAPPAGAFADFCASWLGWDAVSGTEVTHPDIEGLSLPVSEITQTPRKYGFHGTIKPPFRLTGTPEALIGDLDAFCSRNAPVRCDGLALTQLGRFLALTLTGDTQDLATLAGKVVADLDSHRAPQTEAELEKRRKAGLSDRQEDLLQRWGYPYVMEEFKFHLTLSGKLPKAQVSTVAEALEPVLAPLLPEPFELTQLCLFGEAEDGRFHEVSRHTLSG